MEIDRQLVEAWLQRARRAGLAGESGVAAGALASSEAQALLYPGSLKETDGAVFLLLKLPGASPDGPAFARNRALGILGSDGWLSRFRGTAVNLAGGTGVGEGLIGPLSHANAAALRRALPFTAPSILSGREVTFGVGDRLGVAGPGHLRVMRVYQVFPVLAQQSVRELDLTGRDYEQVLDASTWAVFQEGYDRPWGADGDHLKSEEWVRTALRSGFTMITADVSDYI